MTHAKLSPSSSHRWLTCTASVKACEPYQNFGNAASKWGSACHFIGESILLDAPIPKIGDIVEEVEVDQEMLTTAEEYADYVRGHLNQDTVLLVEQTFDMTHLAPEMFGTSDATIIDGTTLHVMDLKTGHNIVQAEGNTQLMMYALGALEHFKDAYIEEVTLHIVQTRAGHVSTWTLSVDELEAFGKLVASVAKNIKEDIVDFHPEEKACQWCDHKANCEALANHVKDIVTGQFENIEDIYGQADSVSFDHIKNILINENLITSFIKAVKDRALEEMQGGKEIEGFKLVRSVKHKKWIDESEAEKYLVRKLKKAGAFKQTLITPTQAIKALGKDNSYIEKLYMVPEGDIVLAPENDKRKAVQNVAEQFEDVKD